MTTQKITTTLLGLLILGFVAYKVVSIFSGVGKGEEAPDFTAELIDGSAYTLSDSRGHYVLLDFWGSWCGPCLRESPQLVAISNKYKDTKFDTTSELHIVTVALEKKGEAWKRAAERFGFDWTRQIVHHHKVVMASPLANDYGVLDLPSKFLIGPDGNIITSKASFEEIDAFLSKRRVNL